jgi:hypothetical protein
VAVGAASCALLANPALYLTDDYATAFMPVFREVARLIWHGQAPLLTDRLWVGGGLLQEYQYGVFNPVSLALYLAIGQIGNLAIAAAVFSIAHIALLAGGAFFLARQIGCGRKQAVLVGALAPLSDWVFAWGAVNWIPALVSLTWLIWAWGSLLLTWRRPRFAPLAAVMIAMTLLSGWPFSDLALVLSLIAAGVLFVVGRTPDRWAKAAPVAAAIIVGGLIAAPATLPLAFYAPSTGRSPIVDTWFATLPALFGVGTPLFATQWSRVAQTADFVFWPTVYASWFAPVAIANANWRQLCASPMVRLVVACAALFAAFSMTPGLWLFRWMFRLLPFYQLAVLLVGARALTQSEENGRNWRLALSLIVVDAEIWLAICQSPPNGLIAAYVGVALCLTLAAWLGGRLAGRRGLAWFGVLAATSLGAFAATVLWMTWDGYPRFPTRWSPPVEAPPATQAMAASPTRFEMFQLGIKAVPEASFWRTYEPGNLSLYQPGASINGYSPTITSPQYAWLCAGHFGSDCDNIVARLVAPEPETGRPLLDLAGVDIVDIQTAANAAAFAARAGADWRVARGPVGDWRFRRSQPSGPVTWTSPAAAAKVLVSGPTDLTLDVANAAPRPGTLVIARAWYPNWTARLNGEPIRARPLSGVVLAIDLPPSSQGQLRVSFWPAGLTAGLIACAIGLALLFGLSLGLADRLRRRLELALPSTA